jgi:hypothetical protein
VPYNSNISFRSTSSKSEGRPATKSFMPIDLRGKNTKIKRIYSIIRNKNIALLLHSLTINRVYSFLPIGSWKRNPL